MNTNELPAPIPPLPCFRCGKPAALRLTWGLYEGPDGRPRTEPMYCEAVCRQCGDELWAASASAVNSGLLHWVNRELVEELPELIEAAKNIHDQLVESAIRHVFQPEDPRRQQLRRVLRGASRP
jgi:hypothetical protein